jgi:hypothetical protein
MTRRWLFVVVALNLSVLVALAFLYPHLMVSPVPLIKGHAELTTDCFACHAPLRGASSERCIGCHALPEIGLRTTRGVARVATTQKPAFHQNLAEQDCMACHSDHLGPRSTLRSPKRFSHALLQPATRERCDSCHKAPTDSLHRAITTNCSQCHGQEAWKPATLDHSRLFVLDRDHETTCATCHTKPDYRQYTCYGCHEHTVANIRSKHEKEGIRDFGNCVQCHRDPGVEPDKQGRVGESGQRKKKEQD